MPTRLRDLVVQSDERQLLWQALRERLSQSQQYQTEELPEIDLDPAMLASFWEYRKLQPISQLHLPIFPRSNPYDQLTSHLPPQIPADQHSAEEPSPANPPETPDYVWSFRGYKLRPGDFTTAMVHFFRAEVQRANVWRQRLDTTTYWAVVTTGAAISIAFSQSSHHLVILLNFLFVTIFLLMEARRYRYYELWAYRVRLMETDFFAPMLVAPFHPSADWAEALSESLLHPQFPISVLEAIGRRLRRNYLYIYWIIGIAWLVKLLLIPIPVQTWGEFVQNASIGPISGMWVLFVTLIFC